MSRSADRAMRLLDAVVSAGAITLGAAAAATELPTSTALRHLRALTQEGYLARDELGRYSVGPAFLRLALSAFRSGPYARLTALAQPHLERLVALTEESAYLAVRDGDNAIYVATVESPRSIRHVGWVGRTAPMAGTAIGDALSASFEASSVASGEGIGPYFNTGASEPDVTAVTAPVFADDQVVAAFSVLGPADRLVGQRLEAAGAAVTDAAQAMALELAT